jgi:hypothetical protein
MQAKRLWLVVFAVFLISGGQMAYACDTAELAYQPICCCEDGMTGCDPAPPAFPVDGCEHDASTAFPGSCCEAEYRSVVKDAAPTVFSDDRALTWLPLVVLVCWPLQESPSTLFIANAPPDPDWLLAQAESGRTAYLATLRLRI